MTEIDVLRATERAPSPRPTGAHGDGLEVTPDTAERHMARLLEILPAGPSSPDGRSDRTPPVADEPRASTDSSAIALGRLLAGARNVLPDAVTRAPRRGQTMGRYLVLGELGRGGMGTVLKAYDESLDRAIAIKLLHSEAAERHALRLRREAQALAKLSHPNIVHVYEVGETEGQWFIAMELVPGRTLREWQQAPRTWQECVKVYLQVGEGLAAAHAMGLVHRDFKPDNCIIEDSGRPKVLDFGLVGGTMAPSVETREKDTELESLRKASASGSLTSTGTVMGTPAYMPPEQIDGLEADARSDQFSFCVSLYEAVYGERPFAGRSLLELSIAMTTKSLRTPPKGTRVPNELRRLLVRGLAIDPTERWPSMEALLDALRPLVAPRRGRWIGLGVGVGVGLLAVGAGLATGELADRIERCTGAQAELEGIWDDARRQEVGAALLGTGVSYAPDTWERVRPHLDEYSSAWVANHTETCEASTIRGEQSPAVMDLRMSCLHERKVALRETVKVLAAADAARVQKAVELVTALPGLSRCDDLEALEAELPPPEVAQAVAGLRERLAEANALTKVGEYDQALTEVDAVVERAEALAYAPLLAEALARRSAAHRLMGESTEAEADAERAYALAVQHGHERAALLATTSLVHVVGVGLERHEAGLQWGKTALPLAEGPKGEPRDVGSVLEAIGGMLTKQDKFDEALDHHQRALAIKQEALGPRHPTVAYSLRSISLVLMEQGKYDEALDYAQRALDIQQEALGPRHPTVAISLKQIGVLLMMQGKPDEALDRLHRALDIQQEALGPRHVLVGGTLSKIGDVLDQQRKLDEALDYHRRALDIQQEALGPGHSVVANTLRNIGGTLRFQGKLDEALDYTQRSLKIWEEALGPRHSKLAYPLLSVGGVLHEQGKLEEALDYYQRALEIWEETLGPRHSELAYPLLNIALVLHKQGKLEEALDYYHRALAIREQELGPRHHLVAAELNGIGIVLYRQGKLEEALSHFQRALKIWEEAFGPDHVKVAEALMGMAEVELAQRDFVTARQHSERAVALFESGETMPRILAEARFVLARALWTDRAERPRARAVAEQARDAFADLGETHADELAEVEQWLAKHRLS